MNHAVLKCVMRPHAAIPGSGMKRLWLNLLSPPVDPALLKAGKRFFARLVVTLVFGSPFTVLSVLDKRHPGLLHQVGRDPIWRPLLMVDALVTVALMLGLMWVGLQAALLQERLRKQRDAGQNGSA
jgi:hypothetical protein